MSSRSPFLRGAPFVNFMDLVRSTPRQSLASEQAKQMMGAGNPLSGKKIRKPASVYCSSCHRWHRPGTPCPNSLKSIDIETFLTKGRVIVTKPKRGNPYHDSDTGQFAGAPSDTKETTGRGAQVSQSEETQEAPREPAKLGPVERELTGHHAQEQTYRDAFRDAKNAGATPKQAEQFAGSQAYPHMFDPPKDFSLPTQQEPQQPPSILTPEHLQNVLAHGADPQQVISQMTPGQQQAMRQAAESGGEYTVPQELAPYFQEFHQQPEYRQQWAEQASPQAMQAAGKMAQGQYGSQFGQGISHGQAIGQGLATPGGSVSPTVSGLQRAPGLLQPQPQQQVQQQQATPQEQQQALETSSQQLQGQQQGYFDRLRQWLGKYVGGGQ